MAKSIRLTEPTYEELDAIKQEIEKNASTTAGAPMTMTFDDLIKRLCQIYKMYGGAC